MSATKRKPHMWTDAQVALLRSLYPDTRTVELAALLGRSLRQVQCKAYTLGLRKSESFAMPRLDGSFVAGRFKRGAAPWNKGVRYDAGGRSVQTQFKPGEKPRNWHPIGYEHIASDGYLQRKVSDTGSKRRDYVAVHRLIWTQHYGPVPEGHHIVFRDGDRTNFDIDNLECISQAESMRRNSVHNLPAELVELVRLRGALNRQINKQVKGEKS